MYFVVVYNVVITQFSQNPISEFCDRKIVRNKSTVKPAHAVTSIKQSLVLKGNLFVVLS